LSTALSITSTLANTRRSWFSSHRSCGVNWFSKQSVIALMDEILRLKDREYQLMPLVHPCL
jgi:hypothetical protein